MASAKRIKAAVDACKGHERDEGYRDGVYRLADSIDAFLKRLVALDRAHWEREPDDRMWQRVE